MTRSTPALIACLLSLGAIDAARAADSPAAPAASMAMNQATSPGHTPADKAMMAGMARMQRQMKAAPMTGDPDHDFVAMMTPHHAGAIDMAQVELRDGKDPELRRLARDIIAAQQREIAQMQAWMTAHAN